MAKRLARHGGVWRDAEHCSRSARKRAAAATSSGSTRGCPVTSATASAPLIDLASFPESTATPAPSMSSARVLCDSVSPDGYRVSTLVVELPRSDLGHLRAYRKFSQNAASSRAIPVSRMIAAAEDRPYIPRQFSLKHRGMDTDRFIEPGDPRWPAVVHWWLQCRDA